MIYSTEPKFRKYAKGYGFLSFARKFGDKYRKKLMNTATKTGVDAVQKTAEATANLIGNKIADKITSVGKSKEKGTNKESRRNLHSTRKKGNKLLMILNCLEHKM